MYLLIFLFLFACIGIVVTAYWSIEAIKTVADKWNLADTFIGAVFLSVGTSFPEFINSIVSGFHDRAGNSPQYALYSFYNITGANIWQVVFLAFIISCIVLVSRFRNRPENLEEMSQIFWRDSLLSWKLITIETTLLLLIFLFPSINIFLYRGFNIYNLIFIFIWLWYISWTYRHPSSSSRARGPVRTRFSSWNKPSLIAATILLWCLFGIFAYANFYITGQFGIGSKTSFGVILSFITSMPEFCVLFFLFRKRDYEIAVGGFFGSSLFNLILPSITNCISGRNLFGHTGAISSANGQATGSGLTDQDKIPYWLGFNIVLLFVFLLSFARVRYLRNSIMFLNGVGIMGAYLAFNFMLGG